MATTYASERFIETFKVVMKEIIEGTAAARKARAEHGLTVRRYYARARNIYVNPKLVRRVIDERYRKEQDREVENGLFQMLLEIAKEMDRESCSVRKKKKKTSNN